MVRFATFNLQIYFMKRTCTHLCVQIFIYTKHEMSLSRLRTQCDVIINRMELLKGE